MFKWLSKLFSNDCPKCDGKNTVSYFGEDDKAGVQMSVYQCSECESEFI